jgi:hypothetical protein
MTVWQAYRRICAEWSLLTAGMLAASIILERLSGIPIDSYLN